MHHEISQGLNISNELYKNLANSRKRAKEFFAGDFLMIRLRLVRFPPGIVKKLHAHGAGPFKIIKRVRPNAYVLELLPNLGISSTFNISNLEEYRDPAKIPSEPFEPCPFFVSEPTPECPHTIWPFSEKKNRRMTNLDLQSCHQSEALGPFGWKNYPSSTCDRTDCHGNYLSR